MSEGRLTRSVREAMELNKKLDRNAEGGRYENDADFTGSETHAVQERHR